MTMTRRKVLATVGAGAASLSTSAWSTSAFAQQTRTRYSATSPQGKQMLAKYANAVRVMADQTAKGDPRSWNFQWYSHWIPGPQSPWSAAVQAKTDMINQVYAGKPPTDPWRVLAQAMWDGCQAHGNNPSDPAAYQETYFLPWHRYFLFFFEEIVRGALGDQSFTLPYWDYLGGTVADLSIPPEFRTDTTSPLYRKDRNSWVNAGERIDKNNPGSLNLNAFREPTYINSSGLGFCPLLDNNPHGLVHSYVGTLTNMGRVPYAGGDPIFWLHHCNLDRLWESWNRQPGRTNPQWPTSRQFPFATANGSGTAVTMIGADRVAKLGYQYDKYYAPLTPAVAAAVANAATVPVTKVAATAEVTLGAEQVRVSLEAPGGLLPNGGPQNLFALSEPSRQHYLVLDGISAPDTVDSTYNVFLDLPEGVSAPTPDNSHYVGTLQFFGVAGHEDHEGGHKTAFNVTDTVETLQSRGELTAATTVTLQRMGTEPEGAKPMVRRVYLVEA